MRLRLFYGWVIVVAAFVVLMAAFGIHRSYGIFLPLFAHDLGMGYGELSAPFSIYISVYALLSFATGRLTDKYGSRLVVLIGGLCLGGGYALMALAEDGWHVYVALCVIAATGMSAAFIPLNATLVKWFVRRRATALALASMGNAASAIYGPGIATLLIPLLGWREALVVLAAATATLICGSALFLLKDPESLGLHPDGEPVHEDEAEAIDGSTLSRSWTLSEALSSLAYRILLVAFTLTWLTLFLPYVHLPAMMSEIGFSTTSTASVIGVMGIGTILGRFIAVGLSKFLGATWGMQCALGFQALAYVMFAQSQSLAGLYLAGLIFASGASAVGILYVLIVSNTFGRLHAGSLTGFIFAASGSVSGLGPYLAGLLRDLTGDFQMSFLAAACCNLAAMIVFMFFGAPCRSAAVQP